MLAIAILIACRQHIIAKAYEGAEAWLPCIKQRVYAMIILPNGEAYYGANWMTVGDVEICPRVAAGVTSYELCATICGQGTEFHAERQAMWSAYYDKADLTGAEVFITGHTYCCDTCRAAMYEEGITYAASLDSGKSYERGVTTMEEANDWTIVSEESVQLIALQSIIWDNCMGGYSHMCDEGDIINGIMCIFANGNVSYSADFNGISDSVELGVDVELAFNEPVFGWEKIPRYEVFTAYSNGQTSFTTLWHKDGIVYCTHREQKQCYNIYNEPSHIDVLVDVPVGVVCDDSTCLYYGAYTEIIWKQLELPAPPDVDYFPSDLDELL